MKLSRKICDCAQSPIRKFYPYAVAAQQRGIRIHQLNIGQPDIQTPPAFFEAIEAGRRDVLAYAESPGIPALLEAIRAYYARIGASFETQDILVTTGGSEALLMAMLCILDEGDEVLIPEPYYPNYFTFIRMAGGRVHPIPTSPEDGYRYAERARVPGHAFAADTPWQREFEDNFGYTETDDQLRCISEIKADMESQTPMDRLLCGDVGYGKTEVALRAAMKCILDNRQAAILVPTTVLAQQHYQTAMQRFFGFPVTVEVLSRFRTPAQIQKTLDDLKTGRCDLVIGTHRLLQKDVKFKNLGLLIVDEEQRFGVGHKEHIKDMSRGVDVLTLSATPIPRTLNMALSGIRDMSSIDEPPQDRLPVQTFVMEHDWGILCDAIRREIQRGGQVYYLHNRIDSIDRTAVRLREMLDNEVTVGVAHGQMDKDMLASVMEDVSEGKVQVLVCTTIIETGIDIPNVNTLIIEDADKMGLAQLHQIRGRVGRSTRRASAYLTFRQNKVLTEVAEKRLEAIREFAEFGSGFKIAMRDLEIRGAGSLLGAEQSGHMTDVGYDMYMKLLSEAVLEERGVKVEHRAECSADLAVAANIPESYIPSEGQRMDIYRRIAMLRSEDEADDLIDELIDRFGDLPSGVSALINVALLRGEAGKAGISDISQKSGKLIFALNDFDMQRISALYARPEYKGFIKVEAGSAPRVSLRLKSNTRIVDQARKFIKSYSEAV
jgi:transcription-repair coupling factor (superfamily II helicase)